jgi:AcrR family transcriptional regulator
VGVIHDHRAPSHCPTLADSRAISRPAAVPASALPPSVFNVMFTNMTVSRSYTMKARAASAAITAERIVEAAKELLMNKVIAEITLADIAARAGVTVQTILRRFGDKDAVFAAAVARFFGQVRAHRGQAVPGALDNLVANLVEHYEQWGRLMLKMVAEETTTPAIHNVVQEGKAYHRRWCETVFADTLTSLRQAERGRRLAELIAICDLRTWEVLRITSGLSPDQTQLALHEMLTPFTTKG